MSPARFWPGSARPCIPHAISVRTYQEQLVDRWLTDGRERAMRPGDAGPSYPNQCHLAGVALRAGHNRFDKGRTYGRNQRSS